VKRIRKTPVGDICPKPVDERIDCREPIPLMRSLLFTCFVPLLLIIAPASAQELAWKSLFDGKSLKGWEARAKGEVKVINGEIQILAKKANLWLVNDLSFDDFEMEVDALMPADGYNSGIGFRCGGEKKPLGYQCEIENEKSGSVYAIGKGWVWPKSPKAFPDFYKTAGDSFKKGEWNKFRIRCEGDHIQIWVNNAKVTDIHDDLFTNGNIALQHHGKGDVHRFKNIRVRELRSQKKGGKAEESK